MSYPYPPVELQAPAGTKPYTPWIWLIVWLPMLPMLTLLAIDWGSLVDISDPTGVGAFAFYADPVYWLNVLGGWVLYGLCAWFAYLDWRELQRRGVPKPFHFAWVFLSWSVYGIGRSVIVRRRTGAGIVPMWVVIAELVLGFVVAGLLVAMIMAPLFAQLSTASFT